MAMSFSETMQELKVWFLKMNEAEIKIKQLLKVEKAEKIEKPVPAKRKRGEGVMKYLVELMADNTPRNVSDMVRDLGILGHSFNSMSVRSAAKYMVSRGMLVMNNETKVFSKKAE